MTEAAKRVLDQAMDLPGGDRAELVAKLLETLDGFVDADVEEAWIREIERRAAALDAGEVETVSWSSFRSEIESEMFDR